VEMENGILDGSRIAMLRMVAATTAPMSSMVQPGGHMLTGGTAGCANGVGAAVADIMGMTGVGGTSGSTTGAVLAHSTI